MYRETGMSSVLSQARNSIGNTLAARQALFVHAGLFVITLLIGIARYSRSIPPQLMTLMTLWSLGLMLHGALIYRVIRSAEPPHPDQQDGLLKTMLLSITANGLMWVMWLLATDGRDSTPWHLSVWLAFVTIAAIAGIVGKRALYNHWLNAFVRDSGETKPKRERLTQLNDDGELTDIWLDDQEDDRSSSNTRQGNI